MTVDQSFKYRAIICKAVCCSVAEGRHRRPVGRPVAAPLRSIPKSKNHKMVLVVSTRRLRPRVFSATVETKSRMAVMTACSAAVNWGPTTAEPNPARTMPIVARRHPRLTDPPAPNRVSPTPATADNTPIVPVWPLDSRRLPLLLLSQPALALVQVQLSPVAHLFPAKEELSLKGERELIMVNNSSQEAPCSPRCSNL